MDDDDKVRRNCVAASTAVLAGWVLDIQQNDVVKKVWGDGLTTKPFRVWTLIFLVLLYLFMRYLFSDERKQAHDEMLDEFYSTRQKVVIARLKREYLQYKRSGRPAKNFKDEGLLVIKEAEKEGRFGFNAFHPTFGIPRELRFTDASWTGRIPVPLGKDAVGQPQQAIVEFKVEPLLRIYSTAYAALKMMTWSKGLTAILIPVPIALGAIIYSICKIISFW